MRTEVQPSHELADHAVDFIELKLFRKQEPEFRENTVAHEAENLDSKPGLPR